MKIHINNSETFETNKEEFTASEFLNLADKIKTISSSEIQNFEYDETTGVYANKISYSKTPNPQIQSQTSPKILIKSPNEEENKLAEHIYDLKKQGKEFSQIAKENKITNSKARKLYGRIYSRIYNRGYKQKEKVEKITKIPRKRGAQKVKWKDKNEVLKVLKIHYHGNKEDKLRYANNIGVTWQYLTKNFHLLLKRFNVKPYEVGLTKFRKRWEYKKGDTQKLKLKQKQNENEKEIISSPENKWTPPLTTEKPYLNEDEIKEIISDEDLSANEQKFVKFFEICQKTSVDESLIKETALLLKDYLIRQGLQGTTDDILNWLSGKFKSMKPIINPVLLDSWVN
jgi:hypothetical protein